jgi:hypothetical protein
MVSGILTVTKGSTTTTVVSVHLTVHQDSLMMVPRATSQIIPTVQDEYQILAQLERSCTSDCAMTLAKPGTVLSLRVALQIAPVTRRILVLSVRNSNTVGELGRYRV